MDSAPSSRVQSIMMRALRQRHGVAGWSHCFHSQDAEMKSVLRSLSPFTQLKIPAQGREPPVFKMGS